MSHITHRILLQSDQHFGKSLPPHYLGYFLAEIPGAVQRSISMALRNRSISRGPRPTWLERAADIRFVDHNGNGQSTLYFEAPTLGEAAHELYEQSELWPSRPDADDTGFDLLGDVLADVAANNADSDHFDPSLLRRILRFKRVFAGPFHEIDITSRRFDSRQPARLSLATIQTAESFLGNTPSPRRVRLVGNLDMLRVSTQTFEFNFDDGQRVRGVLPDGTVDEVKQLLNRRVLVLGKAIYRASGRLLRIDADIVTVGENEPSIWSRLPSPGNGKLDVTRLRQPQGPRSGMAAIMGQWPGEETDEEVRLALEKLS